MVGMEHRDLPALGRKVFFLNPPLSITTYVYDCLKEAQYEVYFIDNYTEAKPVLRLYPDALCFIFIDDQLSLREWYNFIQSFEGDESLKSIFLGVISARIRPADKEKFLMNLKLPGGFVMLGGPVAELYTTIKGILDVNGAMGKRRYLRLDNTRETDISGYLASGFRLYQFSIDTISTAGFTCKMDLKNGFAFTKNMVVQNICINLGRRTVVCTAAVFEVRQTPNETIAILLFTKETDKQSRVAIRNYIYQSLASHMHSIIKSQRPDNENYKDKVSEKASEDETINSIEANEILNNIEDAQEVDDNGNPVEAKSEENTTEEAKTEEAKSENTESEAAEENSAGNKESEN